MVSWFSLARVRVLLFGALASAFFSSASGQTFAEPLTISGTPPGSATVGQTYAFQPDVINPAGLPVSFAIFNNPPWLVLDTVTGTLSGVPGAGDLGTYDAITLVVTDGFIYTTYPFSITVATASSPSPVTPPSPVPPPPAVTSVPPVTPPPPGVQSVTLSWTPPTENTDSSALVNLAGYRIYYRLMGRELINRVDVANAGIAQYTVDNLSSGLWFFCVTAYNTEGAESARSAVVSQVILEQ